MMELEALSFEDGILANVNETGSRLEENKKIIKQWIQCQPHLPSSSYGKMLIKMKKDTDNLFFQMKEF